MAGGIVNAQTWDEATEGGGDAGDYPIGTEQTTAGTGPLTLITGATDGSVDFVDAYSVIITEDTWSMTSSSGDFFDTRLWLFDAATGGVLNGE